ncbi:MAG: DUF5668 domain-containing protein [Sterolibacterium sp.]|jgi:uncharacterized integral membrane protein
MANQQNRWVGGVILIVIGSIFLLANLDLIDRDTLHQLWKFWPLILILLGVRMLWRNEQCRRPPDS